MGVPPAIDEIAHYAIRILGRAVAAESYQRLKQWMVPSSN
jgi:hypothetical protein